MCDCPECRGSFTAKLPEPLNVPTEKSFALNPMDAFDNLLIELRNLHNKKKVDYSKQQDRFSNFREAANFANVSTDKTFEVLLGIKQARLNNLLSSGQVPNNESLRDTYLDRAIYAVLALLYYDYTRS